MSTTEDLEFDAGRQRLWRARDELDELITQCYYLSQALSKVGIMPPSRQIRNWSARLSVVKGIVIEAEAEMARAFYNREKP